MDGIWKVTPIGKYMACVVFEMIWMLRKEKGLLSIHHRGVGDNEAASRSRSSEEKLFHHCTMGNTDWEDGKRNLAFLRGNVTFTFLLLSFVLFVKVDHFRPNFETSPKCIDR